MISSGLRSGTPIERSALSTLALLAAGTACPAAAHRPDHRALDVSRALSATAQIANLNGCRQAWLSVLDRGPRWVSVTPAKEWRQPAQKAEDFAPPPSYPHSVVFYAVVSDEIHQVIEFFNTPAEAEAMLETVLEAPSARR